MVVAVVLLLSACSAGGPTGGLTFTVEGESVEFTVTAADGGTQSATAADGSRFELAVPAGAVLEDTMIRMTPLSDVQGLGDGAVHAVQLEPEGLLLTELARLTIVPAAPIPVADQLMFEASGDGADPALALIDPASKPIVILLEHFSIGGVASVTPQQRATFLEKSAGNAERRISAEVRSRIGEQRVREFTGQGDNDAVDIADLISDLQAEFEREVVDKRRQAAASSCEAIGSYLRTVIGFERQLQLLGATDAAEAASLARITDAITAMEARYTECEKAAITKCQAGPDPDILVSFWTVMGRPADPDRAQKLCDPKGYQFELSGSGPGLDNVFDGQVTITYHYWGLLCEGSDEWKIWEDYEHPTISGSGNAASVPYLATFGNNGSITGIRWPVFSELPGTTFPGTVIALSPGDPPATVRVIMQAGRGTTIPVSAPVVPADGSIAPCD